MIRGVIICPDEELTSQIQEMAEQVSHFAIIKTLDYYPETVQLVRFLRAHAPDVVFLSAASLGNVEEVSTTLDAHIPGLPIIAIGRNNDPTMLMEIMRLGIREFLVFPVNFTAFMDALVRVRDKKEKQAYGIGSTDLVYTFLPAKPGVGASTVCVNAAFALSQIPDLNVLLTDFDLNSGMVRFMLKLQSAHCLVDAAENALRMDENLWPQLVTNVGTLDVLHAGKLNPNFRIEAAQLRSLLAFWRRNYKVICADLSGNLEKYSLELMHESKKIFLVATPEIPSLYLACEKFKYLQQLDLGDRVCLILNRVHKKMFMTEEEITRIVGLPIFMSFQNDYTGVLRALTAAREVAHDSQLGKQFANFAEMLSPKVANAPAPIVKKKFLEYFTI